MYNVLAVISLEMFNGKRPNVGKILIGIVTNPLIIGSVLGVLFVLFQIPIPTPVYDTITDISSIATPLAFIILGASFSFGDVGKYIKEVLLVLGAKLLVFPALFLGIALLLGFRDAPLAVLLTVFGAPIAVSSFTMAQQMGGDDQAGWAAGGVQLHLLHWHHVPADFPPQGAGVPVNRSFRRKVLGFY